MEKMIQSGNRSIFYRVIGDGEPVLLLHGFAEDGEIWRHLVAPLSTDRQLIIPDIPGSGRSGELTEETSIDELASLIGDILIAENIQRCSAIGHSMGGYLVLSLADRKPGLFSRIGLFHSTALPDSEDKKATRLKNAEFIGRHGTPAFLKQSVPNLFSRDSKEKNPGLVDENITRYSNFSSNSLVQYTLAMMGRPDRTHVLRNFSGAVLFIIGEHDTAVPSEQSFRECQLPGISYIYVGTHSAHMGMFEEPEFCIEAVRYFLSGK